MSHSCRQGCANSNANAQRSNSTGKTPKLPPRTCYRPTRPMSLRSPLVLLRYKGACLKSTSLLKPSASRLWHRFRRLGSLNINTTLITCQVHSITPFVLIRARDIRVLLANTARGLRSNTPSPGGCEGRANGHIYKLPNRSPHSHPTLPAPPTSFTSPTSPISPTQPNLRNSLQHHLPHHHGEQIARRAGSGGRLHCRG